MPDVKVYIRTEDLDKWNAIEKKAQWLHDALSGTEIKTKLEAPIVNEYIKEMGMACCLLKTPCKHWSYANEQWTNSLTGEVKDAQA